MASRQSLGQHMRMSVELCQLKSKSIDALCTPLKDKLRFGEHFPDKTVRTPFGGPALTTN